VDDQLELELLASFPCAIVSEESYWLALLRPTASTDAPPDRACVSRRALPVGPHVEIPRIQAAEKARRARRQAKLLERDAESVVDADAVVAPETMAAPEGAAQPAPTGQHHRQRVREARKSAHAAAEHALQRQWRIAACAEQ
jgi:hypothetical protein